MNVGQIDTQVSLDNLVDVVKTEIKKNLRSLLAETLDGSGVKSDYILDKIFPLVETIYNDFVYANKDASRYSSHLSQIADVMGLDWWDGDFPMGEFLDKL